jgi:D-alanyl-D-alanine carboxypeptidase
MASLTKVFTAIEAIESAPGEIEITTTSADLVSDQASSMGFDPGETFTLQELLLGMMLPSGNDAARAIARALGAQPGDSDEQALERFMGRLNQRLRDMGLRETTLVNPDGWGVPGHHSSAHDLAAFTMYALRYPRFVDLISTSEYETAAGYRLRNNNRLLNNYDGLVGGKTGYDNDAGWCLIEVAERDGSTMISVTLDGVAPDDWYDDNRVLLDYAFEQKAARSAAGAGAVGERVGYLDPDAALVARVARAGASLGAPAPSAPLVGGAIPEGAPVTSNRAPNQIARGDADAARRFWTALGVAALVVVGGAARAFRRAAPTPGVRVSAVTTAPRSAVAGTGVPSVRARSGARNVTGARRR